MHITTNAAFPVSLMRPGRRVWERVMAYQPVTVDVLVVDGDSAPLLSRTTPSEAQGLELEHRWFGGRLWRSAFAVVSGDRPGTAMVVRLSTADLARTMSCKAIWSWDRRSAIDGLSSLQSLQEPGVGRLSFGLGHEGAMSRASAVLENRLIVDGMAFEAMTDPAGVSLPYPPKGLSVLHPVRR